MGKRSKTNVVYCIHDDEGNRIQLNGEKAAFSNVVKLRKRYKEDVIVPYIPITEALDDINKMRGEFASVLLMPVFNDEGYKDIPLNIKVYLEALRKALDEPITLKEYSEVRGVNLDKLLAK